MSDGIGRPGGRGGADPDQNADQLSVAGRARSRRRAGCREVAHVDAGGGRQPLEIRRDLDAEFAARVVGPETLAYGSALGVGSDPEGRRTA